LESVLERFADAIVVIDRELTLSRYSSAAAALLDLSQSALGRRIDTLDGVPVLRQLAEVMARCMGDGCAAGREIAIGQRVYLVRLLPEPSLGAGRGGLVAVFVDQTERIELARELRQMATLLNQSDDAILMHDLDGRVLAWNDGAQRMYGYSEREALTMNIDALLPLDRRAEYRGLVERLARGESSQRCETARVRKDGHLIEVWMTASALPDERGNAAAIATTERDLTLRNEIEAKRLRAELAHLERVGIMGEMAASLAHEVNQPLVAIAHFCDAALTRARNTAPQDTRLVQLLDQACEQVHRAGDIVRHLRDFVLKQNRQTVRVDVNELIVETLRFGDAIRRDKDVTVRLDLTEQLPSVMIDKVQIQQVLLHLERNSIEAMQRTSTPQRHLILASARIGTGVCVTIQDSGPGLDVEQIDRMFDPFETSKPAGMGMGLWISRAIVQAHGGRLSCEPVPRGARFHLTLPAAERADVADS